MRLVISPRTLSNGIVEMSLRKEDKAKNIRINKIEMEIKKLLDKN